MDLSPGQKYVIVNADDFGFSPLVSQGIIRAHREGIVTSTTIAANMPSAGDAVGLLANLPALGVGVHLNCTQGPALSKIGLQMLAGDDGVMNFSAAGIIKACLLKPRLIGAIEAEFDAQIQWALAHGIRPTHLDSHRHSHAFLPLFRRVVGLARRYHIRFIRRCREALPGAGWPASSAKQRRIRHMLNCMSALDSLFAGTHCPSAGLWGIEHTGQIDSAWLTKVARSARAGLTEIMTHPGIDGDLAASMTRLRSSREMELAALCDGQVRREFDEQRIALVNYGQL
jgi:predicted glycoside hydrolase/deacetylase ChbG (UPF0249 family)